MPITPAEFERRMEAIAETKDKEARHIDADALMCEILHQFGYTAGVEIFKRMTKWYA